MILAYLRHVIYFKKRGGYMENCYLGMAGHNVFNNKVKDIIHKEKRIGVGRALDRSDWKYSN